MRFSCMSLSRRHLYANSPILQGMDTAAIRRALRAEHLARKKSEHLTLDVLAERTGLDRATIGRVENVRKDPTYEPAFSTVVRLILDGFGYKSVSDFFLQFEGLQTAEAARITGPRQSETRTGSVFGRRYGDSLLESLGVSPTTADARAAVHGFALTLLAATRPDEHAGSFTGARPPEADERHPGALDDGSDVEILRRLDPDTPKKAG